MKISWPKKYINENISLKFSFNDCKSFGKLLFLEYAINFLMENAK
jgi:hypothetical protein